MMTYPLHPDQYAAMRRAAMAENQANPDIQLCELAMAVDEHFQDDTKPAPRLTEMGYQTAIEYGQAEAKRLNPSDGTDYGNAIEAMSAAAIALNAMRDYFKTRLMGYQVEATVPAVLDRLKAKRERGEYHDSILSGRDGDA